nr:hypothetical protein CFP56_73345 [Quercus suber]
MAGAPHVTEQASDPIRPSTSTLTHSEESYALAGLERGTKSATKPAEGTVAKTKEKGLINKHSLATYMDHTYGPMAMIYDKDLGWVDELIGPKTRYWKRIDRKNEKENTGPFQAIVLSNKKRIGSSPLQELDPNSTLLKRSKGKQKVGQHLRNEHSMDGGVAEAAKQPRLAQ